MLHTGPRVYEKLENIKNWNSQRLLLILRREERTVVVTYECLNSIIAYDISPPLALLCS